MELFSDFQRLEEREAIARLLESADDKWLAGVGASRPMAKQCEQQDDEHTDANQQIEALDQDMMLAASASSDTDRPVRLTMQLILQSVRLGMVAMTSAGVGSLGKLRVQEEDDGASDEEDEEDSETNALLRKKVLRLDWLNIGRIENLEAFSHVQELYLQHNLIEVIENLEDHAELRFLALAGNRIRKVEGLRHLEKLRFLDLSDNQIEELDFDELPPSLLIIRIAENPFVRNTPNYVSALFEQFPSLVQVDQYRRENSDSPTSSTSSVTSDDSGVSARIAPLSESHLYAPLSSRSLELETEVLRYKQQMERTFLLASSSVEKESEAIQAVTPADADDITLFDTGTYEELHKSRLAKWKRELDALATRKAELEEDARPVITRSSKGCESSPGFFSKRSKAKERAREAADAAIADATSHLKEMETEHQQWKQRMEARAPSVS